MKKITILVFSLLVIGLSGCLKDKNNVDFSNVGALIEMPYSGLGSFSLDALNFSSDTITQTFTINLASPYPLKQDITVTVGIDTSLVALRNAADTTIHYAVMPASAYSSFPDQTVTIKAGTRLDTFQISFYNTTLDPTLSYMLPISIKSVSDKSVTISGNMGVHYYHAIGNPIAGTYHWSYRRWNATDTTGANSTNPPGSTATFSPVDPSTVTVPSGYYSQPNYIITFTNTGGVLSNFAVTLDQSNITANFTPNNISLTAGPTILKADPVKGIYQFTYSVSSGGNPRTFIDTFYK